MRVLEFNLPEKYPFLAIGSQASLTAYLQQDQDMSDSDIMEKFLRPTLLICPGGGYRRCSLREGEPIAIAFASLGFNCFVLNYSVVPHTWPSALLEVAAAIDLIHQNAEDWNIDISKIVLSGFSAGGHLAASYCTQRNLNEITSLIEPKPVQAALLGYPVISAKENIRHTDSFLHLLGTDSLTQPQIEKFSLELHVDPALTPPTFLWHTASDALVSAENSLLYAQALVRNHVPVELHIFQNGIHGLATSDRQTLRSFDTPNHLHVNQWISLAHSWLSRVCGF